MSTLFLDDEQIKACIDNTDFTSVIDRLIYVDKWSKKSALSAWTIPLTSSH